MMDGLQGGSRSFHGAGNNLYIDLGIGYTGAYIGKTL